METWIGQAGGLSRLPAGLDPLDVGVGIVGALGLLSVFVYIATLRCPKCRRFEIVDHAKHCRWCGDELDVLTERSGWISRVPLVVLPLSAVAATLCFYFHQDQFAMGCLIGAFVVLLVTQNLWGILSVCSNCSRSQIVTRKNVLFQKHCSYCGGRV